MPCTSRSDRCRAVGGVEVHVDAGMVDPGCLRGHEEDPGAVELDLDVRPLRSGLYQADPPWTSYRPPGGFENRDWLLESVIALQEKRTHFFPACALRGRRGWRRRSRPCRRGNAWTIHEKFIANPPHFVIEALSWRVDGSTQRRWIRRRPMATKTPRVDGRRAGSPRDGACQ